MYEDEKKVEIGAWAALILIIVMFFACIKCAAQNNKAQYDTIPCHNECIVRLIAKPTNNGKTKVYAIYNDKAMGISDMIPVTQSVFDYINVCKNNNITPNLGIKLRNGEIYSIIKLRKKYVKSR